MHTVVLEQGWPVLHRGAADIPEKSKPDTIGQSSSQARGGDVACPQAPERATPQEYHREHDSDPSAVDVPEDYYTKAINISHPLILVPGIMGSRLQLQQPTGPPLEVWPPVGYGKRGASISILAGKEKLIAPGLIGGFYTPLVDFLHSIGYEDNINFWQFAYDWTRKNAESAQDLINLIDTIIAKNQSWKTVDIVCHSMGGLVVRSVFQQGVTSKVRRTAYLASPHYGSPKAYFFLHPDIPLEIDGFAASVIAQNIWENIISVPGDPKNLKDAIKDVVKRLPSVYELLPDEFYFGGRHYIYGQFRGGGLGVDEPPQMLTDLEETYYDNMYARFPQAQKPLVEQAVTFKKSLGPTLSGESLVLYSDQIKTDDYVMYDVNAHVWNWTIKASKEQGDGTVPTWSSTLADNRGAEVGGGHSQLPNIEPTFKQLYNFFSKA